MIIGISERSYIVFLFSSMEKRNQGEDCRSPFVINTNDDSCSALSTDDVQSTEVTETNDAKVKVEHS